MGSLGRADRPELAVSGRGLEARYRGRVALQGVDLDVATGAIVGVLGPNGAGKSSLLRLLATGRKPTAGTLELLGHAVFPSATSHQPSTALRRRIGVVPDESILVDPLTARDNAVLFARASGLSRSDARQRTDALLARFQLEADAGRPAAEFSLGMRRRLVLVQALAHDPALLVMDEPATGLDPAGRGILRDILRERAGQGVTAVLASNDVAEVERVCDRVVFLRAGQKVLEGVPAALIAQHGGTTRFTLTLRADRPVAVRVDGLTIAAATAERLVAHSANGSSPLPGLCEAVLNAGAAIESVDVRRPDLSDVFLKATGEELAAGDA